MPTYLQAVSVPERCFLCEVLLWVTFQRLPVSSYDAEGVEIHESREIYDYETDHPDVSDGYFSEDECGRAGISPDPYSQAIIAESSLGSPALYDQILENLDPADPERETFEKTKLEAVEFEAACKAWQVNYQQAIEYPISRIFVALKSGALVAEGRLLPALDIDKAREILDGQGIEIHDIERSVIPPAFWTLKGTNFENCTAHNELAHYCHITCLTRDVLALFPGDREAVVGVERIGDSFVLGDFAQKPLNKSIRGRPSYPWEGFHIEVAAMVRSGSLPQKKEAAIHHFQEWFKREHGISASRAVLGDKLKPYYEKFAKVRRTENPAK